MMSRRTTSWESEYATGYGGEEGMSEETSRTIIWEKHVREDEPVRSFARDILRDKIIDAILQATDEDGTCASAAAEFILALPEVSRPTPSPDLVERVAKEIYENIFVDDWVGGNSAEAAQYRQAARAAIVAMTGVSRVMR